MAVRARSGTSVRSQCKTLCKTTKRAKTMAKGTSPACRFAAASYKPVALFLNVDGTRLDFAERPHEVVTHRRTRDGLGEG
jgi:hypothetical protein